MPDEIKDKVAQLKEEIEGWPAEQKSSFMGGISEGLCLAMLIAEEAGVKLANNKYLQDISNHLCKQKCPPIKRRDKSEQEPKHPRDQLADDITQLLRRSIACRIRIQKSAFDTSLDVEELVSKVLFIVVAIANRSKLDDAIQDIRILRSIARGGFVDRECVKAEVEDCHERFKIEIACFERFNEMTKKGNIKPNGIWSYLRSNVPLDNGYEDEELLEIDAKYFKVV